jgi:hypothetical protein
MAVQLEAAPYRKQTGSERQVWALIKTIGKAEPT